MIESKPDIGIVLCRGINKKGKKFWVYLKPNNIAKLHIIKSDYEKGRTVNFLEYGEVIKKGVSDEVPLAIKKFMEETYNFKHDENSNN